MSRTPQLRDLIPLWQRMSDMTKPECGQSCKIPHSCCSPEYCDEAIFYAKSKWGVTLTPTDHAKLPLMGPDGCIAAPHLRPTCTVHTCDINSFGAKVRPTLDQEWTKAYFKLRNRIEDMEWKLAGVTEPEATPDL